MVEIDAMTLEGLPKGARFVGPVRLGKKALYDPEKKIYIYGDKKLKQRVIKKGGSVNKYGNTLVLRSDDVDTDMVLMERIDAYACTNPAMISGLKNRDGKSFKVDRSYIDRIKKDYRVGRELADVVLEELFGIDPDIARGLYRSARRRRQG